MHVFLKSRVFCGLCLFTYNPRMSFQQGTFSRPQVLGAVLLTAALVLACIGSTLTVIRGDVQYDELEQGTELSRKQQALIRLHAKRSSLKNTYKSMEDNPDVHMVKGASKALSAITSLGHLPSLSLSPAKRHMSAAHPYRPKASAEVALIAKKNGVHISTKLSGNEKAQAALLIADLISSKEEALKDRKPSKKTALRHKMRTALFDYKLYKDQPRNRGVTDTKPQQQIAVDTKAKQQAHALFVAHMQQARLFSQAHMIAADSTTAPAAAPATAPTGSIIPTVSTGSTAPATAPATAPTAPSSPLPPPALSQGFSDAAPVIPNAKILSGPSQQATQPEKATPLALSKAYAGQGGQGSHPHLVDDPQDYRYYATHPHPSLAGFKCGQTGCHVVRATEELSPSGLSLNVEDVTAPSSVAPPNPYLRKTQHTSAIITAGTGGGGGGGGGGAWYHSPDEARKLPHMSGHVGSAAYECTQTGCTLRAAAAKGSKKEGAAKHGYGDTAPAALSRGELLREMERTHWT